jgi:hypothetical protein
MRKFKINCTVDAIDMEAADCLQATLKGDPRFRYVAAVEFRKMKSLKNEPEDALTIGIRPPEGLTMADLDLFEDDPTEEN